MLTQDSTIQDGNGILGHVFGSRDVSRAVANRASAQTGIGADVLKQMLSIVATMVTGGLAKQNSGQAAGMSAGVSASGGGLMGMLGKFLGGR